VREPVDDQVVAARLAQIERFNRDAIELMIPAIRLPATPFAKVEDFRAAYASASAEVINCRIMKAASAA